MIKRMFWPLIKRFKGLFISMVFVSMLSLGLLMAFTNIYLNLQETYHHYNNTYHAPTVTVTTNFHDMHEDIDNVKKIEGVDKAEYRLTFDCYMRKDDGRLITSRVFTYRDDDEVGQLYYKSIDKNQDKSLKPQVAVESRFAMNNNLKVGDHIYLGAFGQFVDFKIKAIVQSPETIYVRVKDYIWSDNTDFGTIYVNSSEAEYFISNVGQLIREKMDADPDFKEMVELALETTAAFIPNYEELLTPEKIGEFVNQFGNQYIFIHKNGTNKTNVAERVKNYLIDKGYQVNEVRELEKSTSYVYMTSALSQIRIAAIFLPVFFYAITLFVIILFISQMVKTMTSDIGIMMSIGIQGKEISGLFSIFIFIMSAVSSFIGLGVAAILMQLLRRAMLKIYQMPFILGGFNPWLLVGGIISLMIIGQLAVLISSRAIYRITPKDAMISNESKRKSLPKWLDKVIDKSPMAMKLGINSVAQNMRRFFVSTFSIFAALTMTMITMMFVDSKNTLLKQSLDDRLSYDCQVYLSEKLTDEKYQALKNQSFVESISSGYYTYLEINNGDKQILVQTVAIDKDVPSDLIYIPDSTGNKPIKTIGEGIILDKRTASTLGVKKGSYVTINNKNVLVEAISYQYFNMTEYMSIDTFTSLDVQSVSTLFVDTSNELAFLKFMSDMGSANVTVFSSSLKKDMQGRLSPINLFAYILVGFSIGMGLMILIIMTQNALLEQKRSLSILRLVGFRVINVSNMWIVQSFLQLLFSNLFAVPAAFGASSLLFTLASSSRQIYPFVLNPLSLTLCFIFIFTVIGFAHLFAMNRIASWNLADNTRSRE